MKVELLIGDVSNVTTRTKATPELVTTISFDAKVQPAILARLVNLQRLGAPLLVTIGSPQATMDLDIVEEREVKKA